MSFLETRERVASALVEAAVAGQNLPQLVQSVCVALRKTTVPLARAAVSTLLLHPLLDATLVIWRYGRGAVVDGTLRPTTRSDEVWRRSPFYRLLTANQHMLRRQIHEFPMLADFAAEGATRRCGTRLTDTPLKSCPMCREISLSISEVQVRGALMPKSLLTSLVLVAWLVGCASSDRDDDWDRDRNDDDTLGGILGGILGGGTGGERVSYRCDDDRRFTAYYDRSGRRVSVDTGRRTYRLRSRDDRDEYEDEDGEVRLVTDGDRAELRIEGADDFKDCDAR